MKLENLDKDVIVHKIGLYSIKRYSYKNFDYIDTDGKKVAERIFSFILMRGEHWFNSTHLNFKESELDNVIEAYEKIVLNMTIERKARLTEERAFRKQFPKKHEFIFDNVNIVAIELPCYYSKGIPSANGIYFEPTEKIVKFYANGFPYRGSKHVNAETIIDLEFVLNSTIDGHIQYNYDKNEFKDTYATQTATKLEFGYIPVIYIIGYVYELDGEQIEFLNYSFGELNNHQGKEFSLLKVMTEGKLIGELQGMKALSSLMNKAKFV